MSASNEPTGPDEKTLLQFPPSAKLVIKVLEHHEKLSQQELQARTYLPSRTVRYALQRLQEEGFIDAEVNIRDARQRLYSLDDEYEQNVEVAREALDD
jgi:DNA-binding MarR family transcriptional regulator